jgi:hypothetical protein
MNPVTSARRRTAGGSTALAVVAILALAGCGSGDAGASSEAAPAPAAVGDGSGGSLRAASGAASAAAGADVAAADGKASSGGTLVSAAAAQAGQRRIRNVEITLQVKQLGPAATRVRQVAANLGGYVSSETTGVSQPVEGVATGSDQPGRSVQAGESVVVLRVPEPELDTAVTQVAAVGTEVSRSQTDQDVTGEIADVSSRIETARRSVARTRELLAKANTVQDIVFIESELTKREGELEAYQARLKSLSDRADFSTLTAVLQVPGTAAAEPEPTTGFLAGLREGWAALVASTNVILTVLGALLPVAVVLAVVGYPASVLLRRRTARQAADREAAAARWMAQHGQPGQPDQPGQPVMVGAAAPAGPAAPARGAGPADPPSGIDRGTTP